MPFKRFSVLLAAPLALLSGCQTIAQLGDHTAATLGLADDAPKTYTSSSVSEPSRGGVAVSDEPLAAKQGALVLAAGGNAVDSVSTMFFTLSATYPVAAGLGAGGICLVRDTGGQVREYDFLTRAPGRGGVNAVPGAVKGFADMQKQQGSLPWQRVVAPGEAYAATGFPISQALSQRLNAAATVVLQDPVLRAEFSDSGKMLDAGMETRNLLLSQALAAIRLNGADGLYKGALAAQVEAGSQAMGGAVDQVELAKQVTTVTAPQTRGMGGFTTFLPSARTGAGVFAASLMSNARSGLSQATQTALTSFGVTALPQDMGSTGFAAVDAYGQAAACAVTMNGPFGRSAGNSGVQLAASPVGQAGLASAFLTPLIATNGEGRVAVTGAGGPNGTAAAVQAVLDATGGRQLGRRGDLRGTGAAPFDTVNAASCDGTFCAALSDPGAHGLGAIADAR
jgi:gamma-glutamyltranspeptidase/glutathione hydrolase